MNKALYIKIFSLYIKVFTLIENKYLKKTILNF